MITVETLLYPLTFFQREGLGLTSESAFAHRYGTNSLNSQLRESEKGPNCISQKEQILEE